MNETLNQKSTSPVIREYKIGDMTYIVKAVTKDGAKEDAATKIRRLIRNDLKQIKNHENPVLSGIVYTTDADDEQVP